MLKFAIALLSIAFLSTCAMAPSVPQAARAELAPTGTLRAGINLGPGLLASKDAVTGEARGVAVDLAQELGKRIGVPVQIVTFTTSGRVADAVKDAWDVAFIGVEPERAETIYFTPAYIEIEATYLVPEGSQIRSIAEVDQEGVRIAVTAKTAFDLFLSRSLKRAQLLRTQGPGTAFKLFTRDKLEAIAALKPTLVGYAEQLPGSRVLEGRFTAVQQSIGAPKGRDAAAKYLAEFVEDVKASGLVARLIEKHGVRGLTVARTAAVTR